MLTLLTRPIEAHRVAFIMFKLIPQAWHQLYKVFN